MAISSKGSTGTLTMIFLNEIQLTKGVFEDFKSLLLNQEIASPFFMSGF
jgi:hypothetical protein